MNTSMMPVFASICIVVIIIIVYIPNYLNPEMTLEVSFFMIL